jgi:hypothetical protein
MRLHSTNNNKTRVWELFERGRDYNSRLVPNQYDLVHTNTEFFIGNQWVNLPNTAAMRSLPKPTFNILKRVASLFIASLTGPGMTMRFEPLAYYDGSNIADPQHDAVVFANAEVQNLLEKFKFEYRLRDALTDGAQTGDYCAHFYWNPDSRPYGGAFGAHKGEIQMELVDGINVMFGNPNNRDTDVQPYILLLGRDTVQSLQDEAEQFKRNKKLYKSGTASNDAEAVQPDMDNDTFPGIGGKTEITASDETGKVLYGLLYTKVTKEVPLLDGNGSEVFEDVVDKNGDPVYEDKLTDSMGNPVPKRRKVTTLETTIHATKATKTAVIYEDVDTGLSRYPIAWGNWEKQKNQYHGRALVTGMIPNQIFINTMFATAMRHLQLMAFPKTIYNADLISAWTNEVGQAIGIHGLQPGQDIGQVARNLQPAEMSNQIFALIDKAMAYTKECLGATDAQMGTANAENTSALMVLQTNSEVPLENIRSGATEWTEDIGHILLDMMGTYYGERPIVLDMEFTEPVTGPDGMPMIDPMTGMMQTQTLVRKVVREFDFSQFKHLWLNLRVDAGATTQFSEIAMTQTLDNLRRDGTLDVIQYLERLPDKLIPKKQELIDELKGRIAEGKQANAAAGAALPQPGSPMQPGKGQPGGPAQGGPVSADKAQQGLPNHMAAVFNELPNIAKKTALAQGSQKAE